MLRTLERTIVFLHPCADDPTTLGGLSANRKCVLSSTLFRRVKVPGSG